MLQLRIEPQKLITVFCVSR